MVYRKNIIRILHDNRYLLFDIEFHCVGVNSCIGVFPCQSSYLNSPLRHERITLLRQLLPGPFNTLVRPMRIPRNSANPRFHGPAVYRFDTYKKLKVKFRQNDILENFIRHRTCVESNLYKWFELMSLTLVRLTGSSKNNKNKWIPLQRFTIIKLSTEIIIIMISLIILILIPH